VVGKGGVGKTTCAIGVASRFASTGQRTLVVSTDPAASLGAALRIDLAPGVLTAIEGVPQLSAMQLDAVSARAAFLGRWRDVLVTIVDRGTYLDADDIGGLVDAAFPGADEIFGLLVLGDLVSNASRAVSGHAQFDRLVVDTAPTGHTLRLLSLPDMFDALVALLDAMQGKHRFMVQALTHRYRRGPADDFLDEMRGMIATLRAALRDAGQTRAVLVSRAESVVVEETVRYSDALRDMGISLGSVVVQALGTKPDRGAAPLLESLAGVAPSGGLFGVPLLDPPPSGVRSILASLGNMERLQARERKSGGKHSPRSEENGSQGTAHPPVDWDLGGAPPAADPGSSAAILRDLLRTLTIVGGKGGVGKTTVACALALAAAADPSTRGEVLLVSTDPASSLGDALRIGNAGWANDRPEQVPRVPRLLAWQMDAPTAFMALRDRYRDRIDAVFDGLMGRNLDLAHDRVIIRDLLALAPPGIDELYALATLGDALAEGHYARIIVDPAPTGHLLRLLELPALAVDWSHRLMRLIMKYKEIAGLGDAAQDLVNFSRRTRALENLLHDSSRAGVVLVWLNQPLVIAETTRLAVALKERRIPILGEVWNRVREAHQVTDRAGQHALPILERLPGFEASEEPESIVGPRAIRNWSCRWRMRSAGMSS
jgi:arsenite-transporting ATPase